MSDRTLDDDSDSNRVLIIGVGIAGPALGLALRRAGIRCAVYDAGAAPRDLGGAFLNVAPNGLKVLEGLGLEHRVEELGFVNDRLVFHDAQGRIQRHVQVGGVTMLRGVLSRVLREAAMNAGVPFVFGKQVEWVQERDGAVTVAFADGTAKTAWLLVGADGVHSRVRRGIFPDAPRPTYTGLVNLGGIVETDLPPTGKAMHVYFGRRAFFGYAVRTSGETYWFSNAPFLEEPLPDDPAVVHGEAYRDRLLELHDGDPPEIAQILGAVGGRIGIYPIYDLPKLSHWHSRCVCLIGDAAHVVTPHMGQGASLALEDAFALSQCLRGASDPSKAFETFEHQRRARIDRASRPARGAVQRINPPTTFGRRIREWVVPRFLRRSPVGVPWMHNYPVDWDEPIGAG
jgi:2-polyprenyl-6-methoxyphenol hydroxylase-like FAD-dependent oxidoreductase